MKNGVLRLAVVLALLLGAAGVKGQDGKSFITLWDTELRVVYLVYDGKEIHGVDVDDKTLYIPIVGENYAVSYRKVGESQWTDAGRHTTQRGKALILKLPTPGKYYVKAGPEGVKAIYGGGQHYTTWTGTNSRLLEVVSFGDVEWGENGLESAFIASTALTTMGVRKAEFPDARLTPKGVKGSLRHLFCDCREFNGDLSQWDVSQVTNLDSTFAGCEKFNGDLSKWNVGNVTSMRSTFYGCDVFNANLSEWNVGRVVRMDDMLHGCYVFSSDISRWNVAQVANMDQLFYYCWAFNADISKWNVARVTTMNRMFYGCKIFNANLSRWDVSNVEDMGFMFWGCEAFNADLSLWNVGKVASIGGMFVRCKAFNYDCITSWVPRSLERGHMFSDAITPAAWSRILKAWGAIADRLPLNAKVGAECKHFKSANAAIAQLNGRGWEILDGGEMDGVIFRYDANGGVFAGGKTTWDDETEGKAEAPKVRPTKAGFVVSGWYQDAACTRKWDFTKSYPMGGSPYTIYAGWRAGKILTIIPPSNGSLEVREGATVLPTGSGVAEGVILTIIATPAEGYTLKSITVNGTPIATSSPATYTVAGDLEVSAEFAEGGNTPVEGLARVVAAPNPFGHSLILMNAERVASYTVLNAKGAVVASGAHDGSPTLQITAQDWPSGFYLVRLVGPDGVKVLRIVKM